MPARSKKKQPPRPTWLRARLARWPLLVYGMGLGRLIAGQVMILTTRGRSTGKARKTPLWYVREGTTLLVFSGWGGTSHWLRNLQAQPQVQIRIGSRRWQTIGHEVEDDRERDRTLLSFRRKYGFLVPILYHLNMLRLVAFPLGQDDRQRG